MSDNLDAIYKRLKKLLAMSEDKSSPAEAANAAAMAENIMRKYQIDQADVIFKELDDGKQEHFGTADVGSRFNQAARGVLNGDRILSTLSVAVARLNDAQALFIQDSFFGRMIRFRGYKPDVEVCRFTFRYIMGTMQRSANVCKDPSFEFKQGFVTAVIEILKQAKTDKDLEAQSNVGSRSLIIVKSDAVGKFFGDVRYAKTSVSGGTASHNQGYAEGKKMDVLRRGVNHTSTSRTAIK